MMVTQCDYVTPLCVVTGCDVMSYLRYEGIFPPGNVIYLCEVECDVVIKSQIL